MKKRIIATFAVIAMFALAIAAFAYTTTDRTVAADKHSCCAKKDSCPMNSKGHEGKEGDHKMSCCKHGNDHAKVEGHSCCGDSCPMKKGKTSTVAGSEEKSCCDDCDSCKAETPKANA